MKLLASVFLVLTFLFGFSGSVMAQQVNNTLPVSFRKQIVITPSGRFTVQLGGADMNTTRVVVDTASPSDCANNCPVLPLAEYARRSGAYAAINGPYFCPSTYPSCASKRNSFDTLIMNKNKTYFNSGNNVYSTIPAVIFTTGSARFVTRSLEWGRDTNVDSVIANYPLLVLNGQQFFFGDGDPKHNSRGLRQFIATKGNMVYIGSISSATMTQAAVVLKTLGVDNALNLDNGGSSAFFWGGYKVGPGRALPAAILFQSR